MAAPLSTAKSAMGVRRFALGFLVLLSMLHNGAAMYCGDKNCYELLG
jgi:hypothetical protein